MSLIDNTKIEPYEMWNNLFNFHNHCLNTTVNTTYNRHNSKLRAARFRGRWHAHRQEQVLWRRKGELPKQKRLNHTNKPEESTPEGMVAEAARKREHRLIKNREATRECRRKKKEYIKVSGPIRLLGFYCRRCDIKYSVPWKPSPSFGGPKQATNWWASKIETNLCWQFTQCRASATRNVFY